MTGRKWRLRTAASTGLLFIPDDLRCGLWIMILTGANSQVVYQSARAAPSTVRRSCQQRHLCCSPQYWLVSCHPRHLWSEWEVGEGNENLVYPSPWDFKRSFTCCKILRHGVLRPIKRKVCCGFSSPLKIHCLGRALTRSLWVQWQLHLTSVTDWKWTIQYKIHSCIKWLDHLERMDRSRLPRLAFQYQPRGRRDMGTPRWRWRDQEHLEL
jgi:hypothetical protein